MGYTVYYSDEILTTKAGFGKVARLPCILDSRPGYHRLGSRYLLDRGLGAWPKTDWGGNASLPTDQTMRNYANWLANFLEWADTRHIDLTACTYAEHVFGRYQSEMFKGLWSRDGHPLSARTINLRIDLACSFLEWMAAQGYRPLFNVPRKPAKFRSLQPTNWITSRNTDVLVREGKLRLNKRRLRMPTDDQVKNWLARVYEKFGYSKGLMCETILLTAVRREEIASWRYDTLPESRTDWHISKIDAPHSDQMVLVNIRFGAKGSSYGYDHGDKVGPERNIWIPLHLAERIHEYRRKLRNPALKVWVRSARTTAEQRRRVVETVHLFLDEKTGKRITSKQLYNCWTGVELPFAGWSPHLGRDWWACSILWMEVAKHERLLSHDTHNSTAILESAAMTVIRFKIQPQLGHAYEGTTMIYLQWIIDMIAKSLPILYEADIIVPVGSSESRSA